MKKLIEAIKNNEVKWSCGLIYLGSFTSDTYQIILDNKEFYVICRGGLFLKDYSSSFDGQPLNFSHKENKALFKAMGNRYFEQRNQQAKEATEDLYNSI